MVGLSLQGPDHRAEAARGHHDLRGRRHRRAQLGEGRLQFRWTPQTDPFGVVHKTIDYPGVPVDHSTVKENHGILKNVRVPIRPHFGVIGLAPKEADIVDSIPPSYSAATSTIGASARARRCTIPVAVPGALLSVGDSARLAGRFRAVRHGDRMLADRHVPAHPAQESRARRHGARSPRLSDAGDQDEWVLHGFSFANYLAELGDKAQSRSTQKSSVDLAMRDAFRKMRAS
jgi:hypothetical protein